MRVVAGELRGRRIVTPAGTSTRPTTGVVREATFNALGSRGLIVGALVADLYAGSGAIGIEALSRGAAHCTFVERDRDALRALRTNLETLELGDRSRIVTGDVLAVAAAVDADLVFADPPYDFDAWDRLLGALRAPFVVAESGAELVAPHSPEGLPDGLPDSLPNGFPHGFVVTRSKRYGRTWVTFFER
ncbi:MAG TPA: 16S rRNA (guanine(966)-N(2))-methyltransferase RsmD [Ilumatobacteraceae bacterium]|nr:16S rRNA (guanine(966)-N(2))-methyltransferase RsmD [Ilumatobacteraceae bacterium]